MRPKGKLLTLIVLFAAVGLITATGAFTTVEAERTATVDVAGDANALLALNEPADSSVTVEESDGVAEIDLTGNSDAAGLNPNANTTLDPVLNITNNGNNDITLDITASISDGPEDAGVEVVSLTSDTLTSGQSAEFGLNIDLTDLDQDDITDNDIEISIQINANESE